jgi:glycosyltransferase involved in cell wall biosynthesis
MFEALGRAMPEARLRIVADAAIEVPGLRVENVPWSLESESRLLAESDIGLAPLPDTPYTRGKCGLKVLEYMAAGLPVVASPVGVNGDYVVPETTGVWATTSEEWIEAVRRLAGDAALRERMGRAGRRRVEAEFDFRVLAPKVVDLVVGALA